MESRMVDHFPCEPWHTSNDLDSMDTRKGLPILPFSIPRITSVRKRVSLIQQEKSPPKYCKNSHYVMVIAVAALTLLVVIVGTIAGLKVVQKGCILDELLKATQDECGGLLQTLQPHSGFINYYPCRHLVYAVRCVHVTLALRGKTCSPVDVYFGLKKRTDCEDPMDSIPGSLVKGMEGDMTYFIAKERCPRELVRLEDSQVNVTSLHSDLMALEKCLSSSLRNHSGNVLSLFPSNRTAPERPSKDVYTNNLTYSTSQFPCLGDLSTEEMGAFVYCSSYQSIANLLNDTKAICRVRGALVQCIEGKLKEVNKPCPRRNIIKRLQADVSWTSDNNSHCNDSDFGVPVDVCKDWMITDAILNRICSSTGTQPFRLRAADKPRTDLFRQCSIYSSLVTCVGEFLGSLSISCEARILEETLSSGEAVVSLIADNFNYSQCPDRTNNTKCTDKHSIQNIVQDKCDIALDFLRQELATSLKCSYYRQFVSCVQSMMYTIGHECYFPQLQRVLIDMTGQDVQVTRLDIDNCIQS